MIVYQLIALGSRKFTQEGGKLHSYRIFGTRSGAKAFIPEFRVKVTTERPGLDLACLEDNDMLCFKVVELEIGFWDVIWQGVKSCGPSTWFGKKTSQASPARVK